MNKMINEIKEIHPDFVCLYKVGTFYHAYGRDAYIMSFLFDYKIKELGDNHKECGFPISTVSRITAKLQNSCVSYLLIDRRNNYDVIFIQKFSCLQLSLYVAISGISEL
ncbi:MAG: hypothetical protein IKD76_00380 [Clostridia bacterium]|nr:hypothetical protein [Clostridia bacterium]